MKVDKLAKVEENFAKLVNGDIEAVVVEFTEINGNNETIKHSYCAEHLIGDIADGVVLGRSCRNTTTDYNWYKGELTSLENAKHAIAYAYSAKGARLRTY